MGKFVFANKQTEEKGLDDHFQTGVIQQNLARVLVPCVRSLETLDKIFLSTLESPEGIEKCKSSNTQIEKF